MSKDITLQEILKSNDKELLEYLREEIYFIMKRGGIFKKIYVAFINEILKEFDRRLALKLRVKLLNKIDNRVRGRYIQVDKNDTTLQYRADVVEVSDLKKWMQEIKEENNS